MTGNIISTIEQKGGATPSTSEQAALKQDEDFRRGGLLLNTIGLDGYRIFTRWNIPAKDMLYSDLIKRFEEKFTGRQNIFITRHRFLMMEQLSSEKVETFIDRVSKASTFCKFGDLEDDMTLQIITKGLRNDKLRKELLATEEPSIAKARNICHLFTSAEESNNFLTDRTETTIAAVESRTGNKPEWRKPSGECFICKSKTHWAKECPNKKRRDTRQEVVCYQCGLKGHIAKFCTSKDRRVREVKARVQQRDRDEPESDESF